MKILILRFSSIGDIVLTTPVIRTLKSQLEDASIHYATKKEFGILLENNPYVDKVHTLENSLNDLVRELKKEQFDYVIDLHHNVRTKIIKTRLRRPSYTLKKLNLLKWIRVNLKIDILPNKHIVDRYMETVEPLKVKMDNLGLDYFIPEKDEVDLEWLPEGFRKKFVAVVIGARYKTKQLPYKRLVELCDRINKPVVLLGGKEDEALGDEIEAFFSRENSPHEETLKDKLGKKTTVYNGCGKFNLNQSASLLKQSMVVFSHDTGLMHIAAAFRKKIYSIWGNTIPEFGMYPYRTQFVIFENKKINCRPCSKIGFDKCPKGHFKCMNDLVFDFYIPES
jgi:ADP-heptose:LPS heptosyltransferase